MTRYICKYASQGLYDRLAIQYTRTMFEGERTFDKAFEHWFDFEPYSGNPGWSDARLATDKYAEEHAIEFLNDHVVMDQNSLFWDLIERNTDEMIDTHLITICATEKKALLIRQLLSEVCNSEWEIILKKA